MCSLILSQFLMGTYLLKMNKRCFSWHIFLDCEEVVFGLTHNSWLWIGFVHPFFSYVLFFIHFYFSPLDTWKNILPHHAILYAMCLWNIPKKFDHAHLLMLTFTHSPNSNPRMNCVYLKLISLGTESKLLLWLPSTPFKL